MSLEFSFILCNRTLYGDGTAEFCVDISFEEFVFFFYIKYQDNQSSLN